MKPFLIDVPVALIFFNRPDTFAKVFEAVAKSRPSKLFLIQDGARENRNDDVENIAKCREVINVDWKCEVHEDFSDHNLGCGARVYSGITNAFKVVDRLVIIEDDIVISEDMLPFCAELLERYKDDQRFYSISCLNHMGTYDTPYSYVFTTRGGGITGWATWKRVWDEMDYSIECADDKFSMSKFRLFKRPKIDGDWWANKVETTHNALKEGKKLSAWSYAFLFTTAFSQNRLRIVSSKNLITNIGLQGANSNASSLTTVPRGLRKIYFAPAHKISWPLNHPKYVIDDYDFATQMDKVLGVGKVRSLLRAIEHKLYCIFPFLGK